MRAVRAFSLLSRAAQVRHLSVMSKIPTIDKKNRLLQIDLRGESLKLPFAWLRDNCQCPECLNAAIKARRHLLINFDPKVEVSKAEVHNTESGNDQAAKLKVQWSDSHWSEYNFRWLQRFSYSEKTRQRREAEKEAIPQRYWNVSKLNEYGGLPRFSYDAILKNSKELREFLSKLIGLGICVLHDVPCERGHVAKVCERIAFVRQSHYGITFTVEAKVDPSNLAYTADNLGLHTDLPYLFEPPGIQLLHCIRQAANQNQGLSQFSDGFFCAEELRKENELHFRALTETKVDFKDYSSDAVDRFWLLATHPIIEAERRDGAVRYANINLSQQQRDAVLRLDDAEKVQCFYEAMHHYNQILYRPDNLLQFRLLPVAYLLVNSTMVPIMTMIPMVTMLPTVAMLPIMSTIPMVTMLPTGTMLPMVTMLPIMSMIPMVTMLPVVTIVTRLDADNAKLMSINLNQAVRDAFLNCDASKIQLFFEAMHHFGRILNYKENCLEFQLKPGEIVVFHNRRVLHGRTSFQGARLLEGCYLGVDEAKSRLRLLLKEHERGNEK